MESLLGFAPFFVYVVIERIIGIMPGLVSAAIVSAILLLRDVISRDRRVKVLEIGTMSSQQVCGRVVVDMRTGKVWGFPTFSPDSYPVNGADTKPRTSHPFALGRFAFEDTDK